MIDYFDFLSRKTDFEKTGWLMKILDFK